MRLSTDSFRNRKSLLRRFACTAIVLCTAWTMTVPAHAQVAPSHDPSRMIRNTDGRYWIFTTGDGVFAMSSPNADFTGWRVEPPVFRVGTWPSWINNYVTGFGGVFWAPDVIFLNNRYYLYYSCAGQGAPAAIGVATATNLAGPWTDQGLVVAGNNAIDPALLIDGSNLWLTWGNWQTGIDLLQLNTSTGKPLNSSRWDLVPGQVEGPYLIRNGSFYYLFFQRGLCCNGLNSTYYTVVGRSSSVTGPYVDKNGVSVLNGGGSVFLPNRDGRFVGPGHVGLGEGRLTYHFYDGNDNGAPKLRVTTMSFSNGWPVAAGVNLPSDQPAPVANGTYRLRNRASGRYLDNLGAPADGASVAQWDGGTSNNQRWVITTSGGFSRLRAVTGGKYLDSVNNTADGSVVGQWTDSPSFNQQWTIVSAGSPYYKLLNRTNGKAVDTGGQTANGTFMQFWPNNPSFNQQWTLELVSTSTSVAAETQGGAPAVSRLAQAPAAGGTELQVLLSPQTSRLTLALSGVPAGQKRVTIENRAGIVLAEAVFEGTKHSISTADIPAGRYVLRVTGDYGLISEREILIKR